VTVVLLDGPMGAELTRRGAHTSTPAWSALPLRDAPALVERVHADYVAAGARVHRTNTFRTRERALGADWERLARRAVDLARRAGATTLLGSLGPIEDCYRPDLAPPDDVAEREHGALARVLVDAGVDGLVCETFPSPREAFAAVRACVRAAGVRPWISLTAGPNGDLLSPRALAEAARGAVAEGATCALVNCVAAERTLPYVRALAAIDLGGASVGAYANGALWGEAPVPPERYAELTASWVDAGARVVGACCGTGPTYVAASARALAGMLAGP
jgi:S-methylmethionine-dependent homocysteine/selenocysteine methylase